MVEVEPDWVPDKTGLFRLYPRYTARKIEKKCGSLVIAFLRSRYGNIERPVNDDLIDLFEAEGAKVELNVEFPPGYGIQGVTDFLSDPVCIRIARGLPKNRERSTIPHEGIHYLLQKDAYKDTNVLDAGSAFRQSCPDRTRLRSGKGEHNWREWQANWGMGVLLIPTHILKMVIGPAPVDQTQRHAAQSPVGEALIAKVSSFFEVSRELAEVRLWKLHYLLSPRRRPGLKLPFDPATDELSGNAGSPCKCSLCAPNDLAPCQELPAMLAIATEQTMLPFDAPMPLEAMDSLI